MAIEPLLSRAGTAVSAASAPPRPATAQQAPRSADEAPAPPVAAGQVRRVVEDINRQLEAAAQNLRFSVDDTTGKTVVRVVDSTTGDVIRQVPSEELLAISRSIDRLQGLLFNKEA
jgi:flagellar protein FlaG